MPRLRTARTAVVIALWAMASNGARGADPPPVKPTADQLAKWVTDLGHPRFTVKAEAAKQLKQAGPAGVIALLGAGDSATVAADSKAEARKLLDELLWPTDEQTIRKSHANLNKLIDRRALDLVGETLLFTRDLADSDTLKAIHRMAQDVTNACNAKAGRKLAAPRPIHDFFRRDDKPETPLSYQTYFASELKRSPKITSATAILGADDFEANRIDSSIVFLRGRLTVEVISHSMVICESVHPPPVKGSKCELAGSIVVTRQPCDIKNVVFSCWVTPPIGARKPAEGKDTILEEDPEKPLFRMIGLRDLGIDALADPAVAGVGLKGIRAGGPAAKAGLAVGERVTAVNGRPVRDPSSLLSLVRQILVRGQPDAYLTVTNSTGTRYVRIALPSFTEDTPRR